MKYIWNCRKLLLKMLKWSFRGTGWRQFLVFLLLGINLSFFIASHKYVRNVKKLQIDSVDTYVCECGHWKKLIFNIFKVPPWHILWPLGDFRDDTEKNTLTSKSHIDDKSPQPLRSSFHLKYISVSRKHSSSIKHRICDKDFTSHSSELIKNSEQVLKIVQLTTSQSNNPSPDGGWDG